MRLELQTLDCGYGHRKVLGGLDLALGAGELVCLLGPNGSGKTSLIKTLAGLLPPLAGGIRVGGRSLDALHPRERSRLLAHVPQAHAPVFAFKVRDVVVMGRTAQWPLWSGPTEADWRAADDALIQVGMQDFAERLYDEISGGERQLVLIARALAQEARFLALDEPASSLDFGNQVKVLATLRRLVDSGIGVIMATHHPEHALRCATRVALLARGRLLACAPPDEALTAARLEELYGVPFLVSEVATPGHPSQRVCIPLSEPRP